MGTERIKLEDTTIEIITKMCEGNPGAVNVLIQLISPGNNFDQDSAMGGFGSVLNLDSYGIYGTDIYILFNDICESQLNKMVAVLRAVQLGFFDRKVLADACHRQDRSGKSLVPVEELYLKVKERLPNFDRN